MTRINNTDKQWRVQVRKSRVHKWVNKGLYETRYSARIDAFWWREGSVHMPDSGVGFGNTRVIPYVKGGK